MKQEEIISMMTGIKKEEISKDIKKQEKLNNLVSKVMEESAMISEDDAELMNYLASTISTLILPLRKMDRIKILEMVLHSELIGKTEEIMEQIGKFSDDT